MSIYEEALERTNPDRIGKPDEGSPEEKAALARITDFFADFSPERVRQKVRSVYADDAYLDDTLKEVYGLDAIEAYFIDSASAAEKATVEFVDTAVSNGDYYLRWVMNIKFRKLKKGQMTRSIGMSHIRFNREGKVIFHQDYWDSARGFFDHIPVVGKILSAIRNRL